MIFGYLDWNTVELNQNTFSSFRLESCVFKSKCKIRLELLRLESNHPKYARVSMTEIHDSRDFGKKF